MSPAVYTLKWLPPDLQGWGERGGDPAADGLTYGMRMKQLICRFQKTVSLTV